MRQLHILLLEDHKMTQKLIQRRLEKVGHTVDIVDNGHQGFLVASANSYDVIISDIQMPHWDGFKFIEAIEVISPQLPILVISSFNNDSTTIKRLQRHNNVVATLTKPVDFDMLNDVLNHLTVKTHVRLNKMARIVATVGPASSSSAVLGKMLLAGMDVARLNFSHGTHEQHGQSLASIREAERLWEKPLAVIADLCGPKIRTGIMEGDGILLESDQEVTITADDITGTTTMFSTISPEILSDLQQGDPILLDDGLLELRVISAGTDSVRCKVVTGGLLRSSKGMNLPETGLSLPSLTPKDIDDLQWILKQDIDYVALSFVRSADDILNLKKIIAVSGNTHIKVLAKIEKPEAIKHISEIIDVADAIMIARGDMGIEIPAARVPRVQQRIINLCWQANKPVITATQMLDSMTTNIRPTRAEVTDVSVAIKEGTDAVMLSQETAMGRDPINVVRTMASIICEEESHAKLTADHYKHLAEETEVNPVLTAVASLTATQATILIDPDGDLYPALSKWNRKVVSVVITRSLQVARHASLFKNIVPLIIRETIQRSDLIHRAVELTQKEGYIRPGDCVALVEGEYTNSFGIKQIGTVQLITV